MKTMNNTCVYLIAGVKNLAVLCAMLLFYNNAQAQESINASGAHTTSSFGTVSYSVGQLVSTTHNSTSGSVAPGVQHAFEIFKVGLKESKLNLSLSIFPNPTSENLTLEIKDYKNEKLFYQLYDMQGKLINNGQITTQQTHLNMHGYATATYLMHVINQDNKKVGSFKIVKTL